MASSAETEVSDQEVEILLAGGKLRFYKAKLHGHA